MGTWGVKTFEDDGASDWVYELEESSGIELLAKALNPDVDDDGYLDADAGTQILCAAEVICAVIGKPSEGLPEEVTNWVEKNKSVDLSELKSSCVSQINLVLADNSELNELWSETEEEYPHWKANVEDLLLRLG